MADTLPEKALESGSEDSGSQREEIFERPTGLKGVYYHPYFQVSMLGFVCFMCPGMFNALGGIGGGGQVNTTAQSNASTATNATFAFFAFFSGSAPLFHTILADVTDTPQNDQQCTWTSTNSIPRNPRILSVYCFISVRILRCNLSCYGHTHVFLGWIIFIPTHTISSSPRVPFLECVLECYGPRRVV